jgi:eukaryotic-like serine/threonine-protein kinase
MSGDGPTRFGPVPRTLVDRQGGACDRFESAWRAGQHPYIEDYLDEASEPERPALLRDLLVLEIGLRLSVGEEPALQEYLARFPQSPDLIKSAFNGSSSSAGLNSTDPQSTEAAPSDVNLDPLALTKKASTTCEPHPSRSAETALVAAPIELAGSSKPRPAAPVTPSLSLPKKIGRYTLHRLLGEGGFGRVYLARDDDLNREVAIKIPRSEAFTTADQVEDFLKEAQLAAGMKHPSIVTVHDVGPHDEWGIFVVLEYIDGRSLADILGSDRVGITRTVELMIQMADAVHYAHKQGLVHRDLKPANILIDLEGRIHVADFGLAIREDGQRLRSGEVSGTPAYMAPEQVRGEAHRLDGRTDLWGLGVIFYEMLTGRHPFHGNRHQTFDEILHREPKPPRQIDDTLPKEIERACLKCLAKRMSDRYTTAAELAEDLRYWLSLQPVATSIMQVSASSISAADSSSERRHAKVVPKGLRSFDNQDADFFLELLPGPKDRGGLPDTLRFWKTRIEETEPDKTFSVGLIYGPSGCGKSSLVKAGILPRLDDRVQPIYIEATPGDTELRLLASLKRRFPALGPDVALHDALAAIRSGLGLPRKNKVLIILDQFEQWLHARPEGREHELTAALRQCDGPRLQAIVMVRDDFWMAITRFMRELEVKLIEGFNSASVDLFDPNHARKVLAEFGRAFGQLPENLGQLTPEQARFVDQSVAELVRPDGSIIPVRLSLFGEMVRGKPWTSATLKEMGGTEGIGVAFLEETFSGPSAPPQHRLHQKAARLVLKALLPEHRIDIKGKMRSYHELLEASGYAQRPAEFHDLLRILDTELRLVTPTDPAGLDEDERDHETSSLDERYYQLTHDDLVPSLRQWLTRKQRETMRGRAEIRLADRSDLWNSKPENRLLPSWWEWPNILLFTNKKQWTVPQRKMMRSAGHHHVTNGLLIAALLLALGFTGLEIKNSLAERQKAIYASGLVSRLLVADISQVPGIVTEITGFRSWTDRELAGIANSPKESPKKRLRASLALVPVDHSQINYLFDRLITAEPDDLLVIRGQLRPSQTELADRLWKLASDPAADRNQRFRAACALADFDPNSSRWNKNVAADVSETLVAENPLLLKSWMDALRPVRAFLLEPLHAIFRDTDPDRPSNERFMATSVLADYAADNLPILAELLKDADGPQYKELFAVIGDRREQIASLMRDELAKKAPDVAEENETDNLSKRQANAAITLFLLGHPDNVWPLLKHSPDPGMRSYLINIMGPRGADARAIIARWKNESDLSTRRALMLSLVEFSESQLPLKERDALVPELLKSYRDDPDPGIHGAAALLLRTWKHGKDLNAINKQLPAKRKEADTWYMNKHGHTMVVIEPAKQSMELLSRRRLVRPFELSAYEVTVKQFLEFRPGEFFNKDISPVPECPMNIITWFEAAAYCRWLSEQEKIAEDQMCYPPIPQIKEGMKPFGDYLKRTGYRLPTDTEWEYACRAGATTSRYFGNSDRLLPKYAWFLLNADMRLNAFIRSRPVGLLKPNEFGLFDMHGNINEWCQESWDYIEQGQMNPGEEDREDILPVANDRRRAVRSGTYQMQGQYLRSDVRDTAVPHDEFNMMGFRVARTHPPKP